MIVNWSYYQHPQNSVLKREMYYKFETDHGLDPFYSFRYRLYNHVSHDLFWEIKFVSIHLYALAQVAVKIAKNTGDTSLKGRFNIGNIGKTVSMDTYNLFESRNTLHISNLWKFQLIMLCH